LGDIKKFWAVYGAGNYQCYTAGTNNVQVGNGKLTIRANIENYLNKNFTSGRIRQLGNGTLYGTFEIRAKLPNGLLLFPALWLKSKSGACYSEIDMIETKGQQPNRLVFTSFYGTIATLVKRGLAPVTTIDSSQRFHVYRLHWTPSRIAWYINRELFFNVSTDSSQWTNPNSPTTCSQAPFIQPMSLIINMAVGSAGIPQVPYFISLISNNRIPFLLKGCLEVGITLQLHKHSNGANQYWKWTTSGFHSGFGTPNKNFLGTFFGLSFKIEIKTLELD